MSAFASVGPSVYWYLTRASGAVALVMLTASVVLGIAGSLRFSSRRWPRFAVETVHRDVSLMVIVFLLIHIATSVLDSFAPISLTAAVIPFISTYRPLWLGLGAVAFDLVLALSLTSLMRRQLGYQTWRAVHWLAYASWPVAVLHGLGTGSDSKVWWMLLLTAACVAAVGVAALLRFSRGEKTPESLRGPAVVMSLAVPVAIAAFTYLGPLQTGWAKRAGTPSSLLAHPVVPPARLVGTRTPTPPVTSAAPRSFTATLTGRITQSNAQGGSLVDLDLRLGGGARGRLRVRLAGAPSAGGGLSMIGSQVDLLKTGLTPVYTGQVSSLEGQRFVAQVAGGGNTLTLDASLDINQQAGTVTGLLHATKASP